MKSGEAFRRPQDGRRFLRAAVDYDDKLDLVFKLTNPQDYGAKMLRMAIASECSADFLSTSVLPFIRVLTAEDICNGMAAASVTEILSTLHAVPGLLSLLRATLDEFTIPDASTVGWLILMWCRQVQSARAENSEVRKFAEVLIEQNNVATRMLRNVLNITDNTDSLLSNPIKTGLVGIEDLYQYAGGRHGNDAIDYRSISLLPTIDELMCNTPPFLPDCAVTEGSALDRQFRLLREDVVGPARQQLRLLRDESAGTLRNYFGNVGIKAASTKGRKACVCVSFALPRGHKTEKMKHEKDRVTYWDTQSRGMLPIDALVCLIRNSEARFLATVVERTSKDLANWPAEHHLPRPLIGLMFEGDTETVANLLFESGRRSARLVVCTQLVTIMIRFSMQSHLEHGPDIY